MVNIWIAHVQCGVLGALRWVRPAVKEVWLERCFGGREARRGVRKAKRHMDDSFDSMSVLLGHPTPLSSQAKDNVVVELGSVGRAIICPYSKRHTPEMQKGDFLNCISSARPIYHLVGVLGGQHSCGSTSNDTTSEI